MVQLDQIDRKILVQLMADATLPVARIADRVGLSQTPCWKRIQKLEAAGVITRRVALVDPQALGLGVTAFVLVALADQGPSARQAFRTAIEALPEVLELWRIAGEHDYLLRLTAPDIAACDAAMSRLGTAVPLRNLTAHLALERIKFTTALPVSGAPA